MRAGLVVARDTIVAPNAAFASLAARPTWVWAFAIVAVVGTLGAFLQAPAGEHVVAASFARTATTDPSMAALSAERRAQLLASASVVQHYAWIAAPLLALAGIAFAALVMLLANAIGKGGATYARCFALAANVALVHYAIAPLFVGLLVLRVGPSEFASARDIFALVPSLGIAAPASAPKLAALLGAINPFSVWSFALVGTGLRRVSGIGTGIAFGAAAVIAFSSYALAAVAAR